MQSWLEPKVSVLVVEPQLLAQVELLDVVHEAHARVDLTCVSTCGGALHAIDVGEVDCLLLSTNLSEPNEERRELAALLREVRARGIPVLSIGDAEPGRLGVALHESLTREDVAFGRLNEVLDRAEARALAGVAGRR